MDSKQCKAIMAARAPFGERGLIEIPMLNYQYRYSSLTDYIDKVFGYNIKIMSKLDILIERLGMGTVNKLMHEHYGTVLPKINSKGKIVGGNVLFFDVDSGRLLSCESLISYLYPWYCFDYYVDSDTFFGEHLISGKQIAIVPDEKTVLLGSLCYPSIDWLAVGTGCDLTDKMMNKFIGRRVVLFPDDFSSTYWHNHFGTMFRVDLSFVNQDINKYLIELIHRTAMA